METNVRDENGVCVVCFSGDVDLESSPGARKTLLDCVGNGQTVLVDLSSVDYIDSSGVASLVEGYQAAKGAGHGFALVAVSEAALRVLKLARLDRIFKIHATVEEGLADGG
jgi:anti-sigma B factor antagonist